MDNVYRKFYKGFYRRTGGFIPAKPISQNVYPGDFFQIRNSEMVKLGNIYRDSSFKNNYRSALVSSENQEIGYGIKLNPANWNFSEDVTKPYSGAGDVQVDSCNDYKFSKQILAFNSFGSYSFHGNEPESIKIQNWMDLQQELIIKLTQTHYSFRELYLVTECATTSDWTLAISSSDKGELEIACDVPNFDYISILGHASSKTIQSKDIEYYNRETERKPAFFKAKKLTVQNENMDVYINELVEQYTYQNEWAGSFFDYDFHQDSKAYTPQVSNVAQANVLDMLQANQLNPNNALRYFKWVDANLDDVEKFFSSYGS